jgi:hypothetical protein
MYYYGSLLEGNGLTVVNRPKMEEAKQVHKCLRTAAGVFKFVKVTTVAEIISSFVQPLLK